MPYTKYSLRRYYSSQSEIHQFYDSETKPGCKIDCGFLRITTPPLLDIHKVCLRRVGSFCEEIQEFTIVRRSKRVYLFCTEYCLMATAPYTKYCHSSHYLSQSKSSQFYHSETEAGGQRLPLEGKLPSNCEADEVLIRAFTLFSAKSPPVSLRLDHSSVPLPPAQSIRRGCDTFVQSKIAIHGEANS